ncbi:hypothetical protein GCM10007301_27080 [Azorhizobium oxalatiphilum]|uniref:Sulfotransferase family protein n=1 Tax=Azorhizobium oxalatiphilum TaxID=980631 RepID=A0A917FCF9_9HYPH|nr:hypothetical protein GCM10007301_27080 [Azorhizobium oxalatiphilum]
MTDSFDASVMTPEMAAAMAPRAVVAGHISITDVERFFPDARLFTVLRDPVDRCLSWYYYARVFPNTDHADVAAAHALGVEDFFAADRAVTFRNIFNRQVRQLGDHVLNTDVDMDAALARAKEVLARCVWIGRQERLDADSVRLGQVFPQMAGVRLGTLNVTPGRPAAREISPELRAAVAAHNRYDMELYAFAESLIAEAERPALHRRAV